MLAPWSAGPTAARMLANNSRPVPTISVARRCAAGRGAGGELVVGNVQGQGARDGVDGDDVAVADPCQRTAGGGLRA